MGYKMKNVMRIKDLSIVTKILITVVILFIGSAGFLLYSNSASEAPSAKPIPPEEAKRILAACADVSADQAAHEKCTAHRFSDLGEQWGIAFIGEVLAAYQGATEGYQNYQNCHVLAHRIMYDLGSRESGKWKELLQQMNEGQLDPNSCGGGFIHGILEVRAGVDPNFKMNADVFRELCTNTLRQELSSSCAHILGHLALVGAFGKVDEALKVCEGLSGDFLFQCYGGIFMEDSMRTNLNAHGLADLPERNIHWFTTQLKRCNGYADEPALVNGCWYDLPEVFEQTHGYDLEKTYKFCESAPNKEAKDHCYIRASYLVALAPDSLFAVFPAKELCAAYESGSNELNRCMKDVVGAALTNSLGFTDRMISFCTERKEASKEGCFGFIAGHVAQSGETGEKKRMLCNKLPAQYQTLCLVDK
ncbi:MAG: hypothetical protein ACR2M4_07750 [Actinomycetota bacterium]